MSARDLTSLARSSMNVSIGDTLVCGAEAPPDLGAWASARSSDHDAAKADCPHFAQFPLFTATSQPLDRNEPRSAHDFGAPVRIDVCCDPPAAEEHFQKKKEFSASIGLELKSSLLVTCTNSQVHVAAELSWMRSTAIARVH